MKFLIRLGIALALALAPIAAPAQDDTAEDTAESTERPLLTDTDTIDQFRFTAIPLVVFADTPEDPRFTRQLELLAARKQALFDRDVVIIADTDPANPSPVRRQLRPRGFSVVLIDKNGRVNLRKPVPWDVRELTRTIDKM
ncbi:MULTISPECIES: DUF4174 domain-containing protein [Meridianimarinicoccus]|uniref:DUF4174 domain-containing protein n=1 Tax=Meridianimarinicoccus zhengii TaxID=2056810 RepID=UPI000DAEA901|nr:DUF4174 domain-containing protein [Phycocomes zhengii]